MHHYIPKEELTRRVTGFQSILQEQGIDGAILVQSVDVYYFSGTMQRSHLFIPAAGEPVLMVKRSFLRAGEESALDHVVHLENPKGMMSVLLSFGFDSMKKIGMELDVLPVAQYQRYGKLLSGIEIVDISAGIRNLRMIKTAYEIDVMKKSAELNCEVYSAIKGLIREGISELTLAGAIEAIYREKGDSGLLRLRGFNQELTFGHLMSGTNLAVSSYFDGPTGGRGPDPTFPQGAGFKLLERNEPILIDYGFSYYGYISDQTRIFCIGSLADHLVKAYDVARRILYRLVEMGKPGVSGEALYLEAIKIAESSGFIDHFMGYPERVAFIGHGLGLELDELPVAAAGVKAPLAQGMVIAIEPKFVFPDGAVGIENTYLVTADGLENMTVFDEDIIYV